MSPSDLQIIEWLCNNVNTFSSFDQIQEFILGQFIFSFLSALSPLKNPVVFEDLESPRQQTVNVFILSSSGHITGSWASFLIKYITFLSVLGSRGSSVMTKRSFIKLELVLGFASLFVPSDPSQECHRDPFTSIRAQQGFSRYRHFPGSPPGNQRLFQATVQVFVSGTGTASV